MSKKELYELLIKNNIYSKIDVNNTKLFENDIVINDSNFNSNKQYKVETNNLQTEDVIIALLAKQTLYFKTIKNVICFFCFISILGIILTLL